MPANRPPPDAVLEEVAELRAGGMTWDAVAVRLKRSVHTLRLWPRKYPRRWAEALRIAERRLLVDHCAESAVTLRHLLRSQDPRHQRGAAGLLIQLRLGLERIDTRRPPPILVITQDDFDRHATKAILGGHSDADQDEYLERVRPRSLPGKGSVHEHADGS